MKKTIIAASLILTTLFAFNEKQKDYVVTFPEAELNKQFNKLNLIKQIADESNLPHPHVKFVILTIDSLQMHIAAQVQKQVTKDSTKKK